MTSKTIYGVKLEILESDFERWSGTIERESSKWIGSGDIAMNVRSKDFHDFQSNREDKMWWAKRF